MINCGIYNTHQKSGDVSARHTTLGAESVPRPGRTGEGTKEGRTRRHIHAVRLMLPKMPDSASFADGGVRKAEKPNEDNISAFGGPAALFSAGVR